MSRRTRMHNIRQTAPNPNRPEIRDPVRDEPIREDGIRADQGRFVRPKKGTMAGIFDDLIPPDGWVYEGKRISTYGQPDQQNIMEVYRYGWEPVPFSRHPNAMPPGYTGTTIERNGMLLMQRPLYVQLEARAEEKQRAEGNIINNQRRLGERTPEDVAAGIERDSPSIRVDIEPGRIPDD